ncbi:hypothetical protein SAMN05216388_101759 [Halorientalis persicus]|uniref:Uncharacterized protein n=1 Tax=Halorientalis persicus TaxID=1367881 RepID=A0A1H8RWJ7_9EURY|nr:hypothetical protein [Halorientalis persicus]SEO70676.1 hypothetical protein SAMN05216388_101759 [Halorientalis persicus]
MTDVLVEPDDTAERLRDYVRAHPDVRKDQYSGYDDPIMGACYVLAESYFHSMGGTDSDLEVYRLGWDDVDPSYDGSHWFLRNADDAVIDLSLPTPEDGDVPWDVAKHRAFITGYEPSNRAQRVLEALNLGD